MTATSTVAAPPGQSYDVKFRIRPLPILVTIVLGLGLPILAAVLLQLAGHYLRFLPTPDGPTLPWLYAHHAVLLALALIAIAIVRGFVPADYGLHLPR